MTIKKGKHRAWPPTVAVWFNKTKLQREFFFDSSCKYELPLEDRDDVNKLMGIGYFPSHQDNSIRFGWNYNARLDKINIYSYYYINGERGFDFLCSVSLNKWYAFIIEVNRGRYFLTVINPVTMQAVEATSIAMQHTNKLGYRLGLYFGGNLSAPKTMIIKSKK